MANQNAVYKESGSEMSLGKTIKHLRERSRMTSAELARRAGVTKPTISKLEDESAKNPTLDNLKKIASALGVSVAYLIGEGYPIPENLRRFALSNGMLYKELDPLLLMTFDKKESTTEEEWKHLLASVKEFPDLYKRMGKIRENGESGSRP